MKSQLTIDCVDIQKKTNKVLHWNFLAWFLARYLAKNTKTTKVPHKFDTKIKLRDTLEVILRNDSNDGDYIFIKRDRVSTPRDKICSRNQKHAIGPLYDQVTWYGINYAGTQIRQWGVQNKGKSGWSGKSSFVLEVSLRYLRPSIIYSIPRERIAQRAYYIIIDRLGIV